MSDRIKLAEAMGLLPADFQGWGEYKDAVAKYDGEVRRILLALIPDPENDANDDYAVLEWARTNPDGFGVCYKDKWMGWTTFMHMNEQEGHQYKIGDYARAAVLVLGKQSK